MRSSVRGAQHRLADVQQIGADRFQLGRIEAQGVVEDAAARGLIELEQRGADGVGGIDAEFERGDRGDGTGERGALGGVVAMLLRIDRAAKRACGLFEAERDQLQRAAQP